MEREAFRLRMQQYKQARELNPLLKYWDWKKENDLGYQLYKINLPSNLQIETDDYDLYGAYKANMQPVLYKDRTYHLGSRDPYTGRILKSKEHPTYRKAIEEEIAAGYFPYEKNGNTYTKTYSPIDISGYSEGTDGIYDPKITAEGYDALGYYAQATNPLPEVVVTGDKSKVLPKTNVVREGLGFVPYVGDALDVGDIVDNVQNNNYSEAAIGAGLLLLPNVIEKPLKAAIRSGKRFIRHLNASKTIKDYNLPSDRIAEIAKKLTISELGHGQYFEAPLYDEDDLRAISRRYRTFVSGNKTSNLYEKMDYVNSHIPINEVGDYDKQAELYNLFDEDPRYFDFVNTTGKNPFSQVTVNAFLKKQFTHIRGVSFPDGASDDLVERALTTNNKINKGGDRLDTDGTGVYVSNSGEIADRFSRPFGKNPAARSDVAIVTYPYKTDKSLPIRELLAQARRKIFPDLGLGLPSPSYKVLSENGYVAKESQYTTRQGNKLPGYERAYIDKDTGKKLLNIEDQTTKYGLSDAKGRWGLGGVKSNSVLEAKLFEGENIGTSFGDYIHFMKTLKDPRNNQTIEYYDWDKTLSKNVEKVKKNIAKRHSEFIDLNKLFKNSIPYKIYKAAIDPVNYILPVAGVASAFGGKRVYDEYEAREKTVGPFVNGEYDEIIPEKEREKIKLLIDKGDVLESSDMIKKYLTENKYALGTDGIDDGTPSIPQAPYMRHNYDYFLPISDTYREPFDGVYEDARFFDQSKPRFELRKGKEPYYANSKGLKILRGLGKTIKVLGPVGEFILNVFPSEELEMLEDLRVKMENTFKPKVYAEGTDSIEEDPPTQQIWTPEDIDNPVYSKNKSLSIKDLEELLIKSRLLQGLQNLLNIGNYAYVAAGFTPLVGDLLSIYDTGNAIVNKDWLGASLAALAVAPFVPSNTKTIRKYIPTVNRSSVTELLNRIQGITPNLDKLQRESDWNNLRNRSIERLYDKDVRDRAAKIKDDYGIDLLSTYDDIINQYENAYYTLPEADVVNLPDAKAKMDIKAEADRRYKQYGIKPKQSDFTMKVDNAVKPSLEIADHEMTHFNQYIHQDNPSWNNSDLSKLTKQFDKALRDLNPIAPEYTDYFKNWMELASYGVNMLNRLKEKNIEPTKKNILNYLKSLPDTDAIKRAALQFKTLDDYIKWLETMPLANNTSTNKNIENYSLA